MNRQISRVAFAALIMLAALIVATTRATSKPIAVQPTRMI